MTTGAVLVTYMAHTDNIHQEWVEGTYDYKIGDDVIFLPNGLSFRVYDKKMFNRMKQNNNYVKVKP